MPIQIKKSEVPTTVLKQKGPQVSNKIPKISPNSLKNTSVIEESMIVGTRETKKTSKQCWMDRRAWASFLSWMVEGVRPHRLSLRRLRVMRGIWPGYCSSRPLEMHAKVMARMLRCCSRFRAEAGDMGRLIWRVPLGITRFRINRIRVTILEMSNYIEKTCRIFRISMYASCVWYWRNKIRNSVMKAKNPETCANFS